MSTEIELLSHIMKQGADLGHLTGLVEQSLENQKEFNQHLVRLLEGHNKLIQEGKQATAAAQERAEMAHRRVSGLVSRGKWVVGAFTAGMGLAGATLWDKLNYILTELRSP